MSGRELLLRRALRLSLLSILLAGAFGIVGVAAALVSGSLSLLGFGFNAVIDASASVALVWRFRIETAQPERAHRVETVAEATLGAILLVFAAYLGLSSVRALIDGAHPESTTMGTALLLISLVVLPPLALAKYRTAQALASRALRADSILTAMAALLAVISLAGLLMSESLGLVWADAVGAMAVAAILVREGLTSVLAVRSRDPI